MREARRAKRRARLRFGPDTMRCPCWIDVIVPMALIIVSATARCIPVRPEVSKGERASFMLRYLSTNGDGPAETMIMAVPIKLPRGCSSASATCCAMEYPCFSGMMYHNVITVMKWSKCK